PPRSIAPSGGPVIGPPSASSTVIVSVDADVPFAITVVGEAASSDSSASGACAVKVIAGNAPSATPLTSTVSVTVSAVVFVTENVDRKSAVSGKPPALGAPR